MAVNLINTFRQTVGDQMVSRISGFLGEPNEHTSSAINVLLPALLGGLIEKGAQQEGANQLLEFLKQESINGNLLSNMSTLFTGGEATEGLIAQGEKVVEFIFGKKSGIQAAILKELSTKSSITRGSANSLIRLISPMLMGVIGRHVNEHDLQAKGLQSLLLEQKQFLKESTPKDFFKNLGFSSFFAQTATEPSTATSEEEAISAEVPAKKPSLLSKIGPWLILGTLALGLLLGMRACGGRPDGISTMIEDPEEAKDSLIQKEPIPSGAIVDSNKVASSRNTLEIGDTTTLRAIIQSNQGFIQKVHAHLYGAVGNQETRYTFDELEFRSGSAQITAPSMRQIDHLASLMFAYPDANIRIEGYVDDQGEDEPSLSEERATAVKNALIELGVNGGRIEAIGDQTAEPPKPGDVAPGQRVDIFILSK